MDALNDPKTHTIVFMKSAQVGATEMLNNIVGYLMDHDPGPVLVLQPTIEMGKAWSKDRLAPMLRDTPALHGKVGERRSKDSENTILHKVFPGGHLTVAGANSAASLASRPIRVVLADEVDRYPPSAGSEGDPLNLAFKRTQTFYNRKRLVTSTPTIKGQSRIEAAFEESNQQFYYVPCPHCGEFQRLMWANVSWPDGQPEAATLVCEHCGTVIEDRDRYDMLARGEWRAHGEFHGVAGFHISELYSPWSTPSEMARAFVEAKRLPETLKTFINTGLGEVWEQDSEKIDAHWVQERAEDYAVPEGVLCVTAAVDVQDDRLEIEFKGWGDEVECWSLDHVVLYGDPSRLELWKRLDEQLSRTFDRADETTLRVAATCIDSGGHFTDEVYKFCQPRFGRRIYAVKGQGGPGLPLVKRPSKNNRQKCPLFTVGTDTAKELLFMRLRIEQHGPGFMHWPDRYDDEWFLQLTSEERREKFSRGRVGYEYRAIRRRNEALDLQVYNLAAIELLNPNFQAIKAGQEKQAKPKKPREKRSPVVPRQRKSNFATGWK